MNLGEEQRMQGVLTIEVIDVSSGAVVETRRVPNLITTAGKELLAKLLMGKIGAVPSSWAIAVGIGNADPQASDTRLLGYADRANATTDVAIITTDKGSIVRATVRAQLPPLAQAEQPQPLVEAGIVIITGLSTETLFNRVKFAQVSRGPMMVLNLAWEISF
jgi:hypothetical protein